MPECPLPSLPTTGLGPPGPSAHTDPGCPPSQHPGSAPRPHGLLPSSPTACSGFCRKRGGTVYLFPSAALATYHKCSGLKRRNLSSAQSWRSGGQSHRANPGPGLPGGSGGQSSPCLFQLPEATRPAGLVAPPSLYTASRVTSSNPPLTPSPASFLLLLLTPPRLPPSYKAPRDSIGPTWIIQAALPTP